MLITTTYTCELGSQFWGNPQIYQHLYIFSYVWVIEDLYTPTSNFDVN
jgi:hypothetical protein